ncbi:proton pump-interactor 1-like [Heracleum sosnowskyi]|uniref:Proton pump-interactor 1-like n=1 Tax=Heracleum sosnowskyi TaxID=360622 RepID=A0AAD8N3S6_9APIA|nr:proton pump-interactor 1-like [Heracleum sosnowskyi]
MTSYDESNLFRQIIDEKRKGTGPLHQALGKLRNSNTADREKSLICSSEEVLNDVIKIIAYRTQDESIPLSEKEQIIREIKELEGTREKVIANSVERGKFEESLGEKEAIHDQVKLIGSGLDGVSKEKEVVETKLDQEKKVIEEAIKALEDEVKTILADMQKIGVKSQELRTQRDKGTVFVSKEASLENSAEITTVG